MGKKKRKLKNDTNIVKTKKTSKGKDCHISSDEIRNDLKPGEYKSSWKITILFFLCLSILIFIIYLPALNAGFYYDDNHTVLTQHLIRDIGWRELIGDVLTMQPRSLLTLSYVLNFKISNIEPLSYHILSILIHLLNSFLVFGLMRYLLKIFNSGFSRKLNNIMPYLVSIIFAIHPLMTEGVTYITSRSDQISTTMTFLAIIFFLKYLLNKKIINIILLLISSYLGLLGKDTSIMIVFILIMITFFYIREKKLKYIAIKNWIILIPSIFLFVTQALVSYGTLNVISRASGLGELVKTTPLIHYMFSELFGNIFYLRLLSFPIGQSIRHDLILIDSITHPRMIFAIGMFLLIFYLVWKFFRNNNLFLIGFFYYIMALAPVASIIRLIEIIAEHRLYHPSFGFYVCITIVILKVIEWILKKLQITNYKLQIITPIIVFSLIFITLSGLTYNRNKVWLGEIPLWTDALAKKDKDTISTVIINNVGLAYFRDGQMKIAEKYYRKGAIESRLSSYHNLANLGTLYRNNGEYERAIGMFDLAIRAKPSFAYAHFDQGVSYAQLGDMKKAKEKFLDTLDHDQYYLGAHRNLGILERDAGNLDEALEYFEKGLQLEPYDGKYYFDIAMVYMEKGDLKNAEKNLKISIQMRPDHLSSYLNLGLVYLDLGEYKNAVDLFQHAYSVNTIYVDALYYMAVGYDMMGDKVNAKKFYIETININSKKAKEAQIALGKL